MVVTFLSQLGGFSSSKSEIGSSSDEENVAANPKAKSRISLQLADRTKSTSSGYVSSQALAQISFRTSLQDRRRETVILSAQTP